VLILRPQRLLHEMPVMSPNIVVEGPIGFFADRNSCKSHLFEQAVLERSEDPLDSALGLRRVGMDKLNFQPHRCPLELRLRVFIRRSSSVSGWREVL